jgi:RNA polymerase sigma-70 factor (ECF subfamily)
MQDQKEVYISIFNEYRDKILRLCFAYLDDRSYAEDIFQEVLLAIWIGLKKFRNESSYGTWVYRITVNTIFLFNKREGKRKTDQIHENIIDSSVHEMEHKIHKESKLESLYEAIASLDEFDRILMGLYLEKLKYEEIGSILGISTNHVGVKISRIKDLIQKQLNL